MGIRFRVTERVNSKHPLQELARLDQKDDAAPALDSLERQSAMRFISLGAIRRRKSAKSDP
jgi:hypothetical protein